MQAQQSGDVVLGRWLGFGLMFALLGLPIIYMMIHSENQMPWIVSLSVV